HFFRPSVIISQQLPKTVLRFPGKNLPDFLSGLIFSQSSESGHAYIILSIITFSNTITPGRIPPPRFPCITSFPASGKDRRVASGYGCSGNRYLEPFLFSGLKAGKAPSWLP